LIRRVKARLYFSAKADRDKAKTDTETDLSSKNARQQAVTAVDSDFREGAVILLVVDATLDDAVNGKDSHDKLAKLLKDRQVVKGFVSSHDCTHDDPVVFPCDQSNYVVDKK
jgi:predicted metalloprotease with PDZ domain